MEITIEQTRKVSELIKKSSGNTAKLTQYGSESIVHVTTDSGDGRFARTTLGTDGSVSDQRSVASFGRSGH